MAKIFDGWRSEKEVLKDFGDSSNKGYEIVFAHVDRKAEYEPFTVLMSKNGKMYYTVGNLTEFQDNEQSLFDMLDDATLKDFTRMFSTEKWYKKHKVDIEESFKQAVKEELYYNKFARLLK